MMSRRSSALSRAIVSWLAYDSRFTWSDCRLRFVAKTVHTHGITGENRVFHAWIETLRQFRKHLLGSAEQRDLVRIVDREHRRSRDQLGSKTSLSETFDVVQTGD